MSDKAGTAGSFEVLSRMCSDNLDIRLAPGGNLRRMNASGAMTEITMGVDGNPIASIIAGKTNVVMLLFNLEQFEQTKKKIEAERAEAATDPADLDGFISRTVERICPAPLCVSETALRQLRPLFAEYLRLRVVAEDVLENAELDFQPALVSKALRAALKR